MEMAAELEEKLREAASTGDMEMIRNLVEVRRININSQNSMNGRTALHWGAKRNHSAVVSYLLQHGADYSIVDKDGKLASQLTSSPEIHSMLNGSGDVASMENGLPILPHYLKFPTFPYLSGKTPKVSGTERFLQQTSTVNNHAVLSDDELVLKARIANSEDTDFIEVELPRAQPRYDTLLNLLCAELRVDKQLVWRIRKLPDTVIRKDKDVARLQEFQELELVLTTSAISASSRNYRGVASKINLASEQILY